MTFFQEWLLGVKTAWKEAKEQSSQRSAKYVRKTDQARPISSRTSRDTNSVVTLPATRDVSDVERDAKTQKRESTKALKLQDVDGFENPPDRSILDADFLREIDRRAADHVVPIATRQSTGIVEIQEARPFLPTPRKNSIAAPTVLEACTKRSHADSSMVADIEDVMRARKKVKQLEEQLEIAQAELSMYTSSLASFTLTQDQSLLDESMHNESFGSKHDIKHNSSTDGRSRRRTYKPRTSTSPTPREAQGSRNRSPTGDDAPRIDSSQLDGNLKKADTPDKERSLSSEKFILSPCEMELSPVKMSLEDFSNGEIARKDAVKALKKRINKGR